MEKINFKELVSHRKKELSYKNPIKNKTNNKCDNCCFMESFSPSLHRCDLISYDFEFKCTSINIFGVCDFFSTERNEDFVKRFPIIIYEDLQEDASR